MSVKDKINNFLTKASEKWAKYKAEEDERQKRKLKRLEFEAKKTKLQAEIAKNQNKINKNKPKNSILDEVGKW